MNGMLMLMILQEGCLVVFGVSRCVLVCGIYACERWMSLNRGVVMPRPIGLEVGH